MLLLKQQIFFKVKQTLLAKTFFEKIRKLFTWFVRYHKPTHKLKSARGNHFLNIPHNTHMTCYHPTTVSLWLPLALFNL